MADSTRNNMSKFRVWFCKTLQVLRMYRTMDIREAISYAQLFVWANFLDQVF